MCMLVGGWPPWKSSTGSSPKYCPVGDGKGWVGEGEMWVYSFISILHTTSFLFMVAEALPAHAEAPSSPIDFPLLPHFPYHHRLFHSNSKTSYMTLHSIMYVGAHHGSLGEVDAPSRAPAGADEVSLWPQVSHRSAALSGQLILPRLGAHQHRKCVTSAMTRIQTAGQPLHCAGQESPVRQLASHCTVQVRTKSTTWID